MAELYYETFTLRSQGGGGGGQNIDVFGMCVVLAEVCSIQDAFHMDLWLIARKKSRKPVAVTE